MNPVSYSEAMPPAKKSLVERPAFHMLYLFFYFTPWLFRAPNQSDILAAAIAFIVFCPLYFRSFAKSAPVYLLYAFAVEGIALAVGPFFGVEGTYHIYAASIAGFQSNVRRGIGSIVLLCVIYGLFAHYIIEMPFERTVLIVFLSGIVGATSIATTQSIIIRDARERSLLLDRQLAAVEERERIAGDLHDILGHTLTMVAVKADLAARLLDSDEDKARKEIMDIRQAARVALEDVRSTVEGMTVVTIEQEIDRARESLVAMDISFEVSGYVPYLPARAQKAVGLAIREAVTNIVRHSEATSAHLSLDERDGVFTFSMHDNGKGAGEHARVQDGAGLQGLRRRITALGGHTVVEMNAGTRLEVSLPLARKDAL